MSSTGISCPACAEALPQNARFCPACGARLQVREEAHSRYMSVLFCDLAGSTSMAGNIGDEAMFTLIQRYQEVCNQVTEAEGGYVAKYMGDGMLAYFGYPDAMKNSAAKAVSAALRILRKTAAITLPDGGTLTASAGVATGWMVVGDARAGAAAAEVMAIGSTVNLAARLQAEAGPGRIAVAPTTSHRLSPQHFALSRLGLRPIKGFAESMEVWLADEADSAAPASVFVGRNKLKQTLTEAWLTAQDHQITFAEVVAPGGYGKTALAKAFLKETVDESNVFFLRGEAHRSEKEFSAFRRLIRDLAGINRAEPPAAQLASLQAWAPAAARNGLAMLCDLHNGPVPPLVRTETISRALSQALSERLPLGPAVLFADDAHWLDPGSAGLLAELPGLLPDRPMLVLITRRPEGAEVPVPDHFSIALDSMAAPEAHSLIAALDTACIIPDATRHQIVKQAEGVPLFLEHITRAVLERPGSLPDEAAPVTMIEALHERFSHLGDALTLVEAAAVLGQELPISVLARMAGRDEPQVSDQVARLVGRGLFRLRGGGEVAFDHALIRDAVLDTLLKPRLKNLHDAALTAYQEAAPGSLEAEPVIAATHLMGAGRSAEGIPQLLAAAQTALMRGEIAEAARLLRWAEGGLAEVPPDSGLRDGLEMAVQFSLGLALVQHRGFSDDAVADAYERALELCQAGEGGSEAEFQIAWGIWAHYMVAGGTDRALQMTRRMSAIAETETALEVLAASARSLVLCNQGEFTAQEEAASRVDALYSPELHRLHGLTYSMDSLAMAHLFRIHGRYICGDLTGWQAAFQAARSHESFLELPILKPYVQIYSIAPQTYARPEQGCRAELEEATAYAAEIGQPFWVTAGSVWLAHEAVHSRGPATALPDMQQAVGVLQAIGMKLGSAYHEAMLAYCSACAGEHGPVPGLISSATDALTAGRDLMYAPEVHRLAAEALLQDPAVDTRAAQQHLTISATLAAQQGSRAWAALTAASQARLTLAEADRETAEHQLQEALALIVPDDSHAHPAFEAARTAFEVLT